MWTGWTLSLYDLGASLSLSPVPGDALPEVEFPPDVAELLLDGDVLTQTLGGLEKNISEALKLMEMSIEDTLKTVQNSRKELK